MRVLYRVARPSNNIRAGRAVTRGSIPFPGLADALFAKVQQRVLAVLFGNPRRSFYYGSIAKGDDTAASDIDLMVISDRLTYPDLFAALEKVSIQLGRKVAPTIYSSKELPKRVKQDNAFVTRVLAQPKLWLIGDARGLAT